MELLEHTGTLIDYNNSYVKESPSIAREVNRHVRITGLKNYYDRNKDNSYRLLWVLEGVKSIQIDTEEFPSFPNLIVFISPGQKLIYTSAGNPQGWVLQLSKAYYNLLRYENLAFGNLELFSSQAVIQKIVLSPKIGERIHALAGMIDELAGSQISNKEKGIHALLKAILVYCDSNCNVSLNRGLSTQEVNIVSRFKQLVSENYTRLHMVSDYSRIMNKTPKYINQVVKQILRITAKQVIQEQIIIRARRELKFSNQSIKEIAFLLGFSDPYHFSNFFKEMVGLPPVRYRNR